MAARGKVAGPFRVEIDGEEQVLLALGRMQHVFDDMRPVWDAFREAFIVAEQQQFESQGAAGRSGAWQPLSPAYAAWKAAHYPGAGILVRSGALQAALLGGSGHVYEPHPTWMGIGAAVPYGMYHQRGDGVPQRKPIDISAEQEAGLFGRAVGETARQLGKMWGGSGMRPFALT